ncbi:hypothetical protein AMTRI_Chr07g29330 [Amborella trichopoda]
MEMQRFPISIFLLFPIVLGLLVTSTGVSLVELEAEALFNWKTSLNASNLDSWFLNFANRTSHCGWAGVRCDNGGRIIEIKLFNFGLRGTLDELNFLSLPYFTHLNLSSNNLEGRIPNSIGTLSNLSVLDLGSNIFTGLVPVEIGNLTELHSISLKSNSLSGSIPYHLGKLKQVWLKTT